MSDKYILNRNGEPEPCDDVLAWGRWFEKNGDSRIVGKTLIGDVKVSTVFLGLDHRFTNTGEPLLWETMIFGGEHDGWQERYTSLEDAKRGHLAAIQLAKQKEGAAK